MFCERLAPVRERREHRELVKLSEYREFLTRPQDDGFYSFEVLKALAETFGSEIIESPGHS